MDVGVVSDIHANRVALNAVLEDMPDVDQLVCVGDIIGYNPWPADCVSIIRDQATATVQGNHDRQIETPERYADHPMAGPALQLAANQLSDEAKDWLVNLPETMCICDDRVKMVHSHPEYTDKYVHPLEFPNLDRHINTEDVLLLGHTHRQHAEVVDGTLVLNPGSVGQPRDGNPDAAYAILHLDARTLSGMYDLRRVASRTISMLSSKQLPTTTSQNKPDNDSAKGNKHY